MKIHVERQITVALANQPGELAAICKLLSTQAINIEALSLIDSLEQGVVRLLTSDPEACKKVLQSSGFYVIEGEVLVLDLFDRVGKLSEITATLAEAKVNVDYVKTVRLKDLFAGYGVTGQESYDPLFETVDQRQSLNINGVSAQQLADSCELARLIRKSDCELSLYVDFHSFGLRA